MTWNGLCFYSDVRSHIARQVFLAGRFCLVLVFIALQSSIAKCRLNSNKVLLMPMSLATNSMSNKKEISHEQQ
jgi:hypothetical protein